MTISIISEYLKILWKIVCVLSSLIPRFGKETTHNQCTFNILYKWSKRRGTGAQHTDKKQRKLWNNKSRWTWRQQRYINPHRTFWGITQTNFRPSYILHDIGFDDTFTSNWTSCWATNKIRKVHCNNVCTCFSQVFNRVIVRC